MTIIQPVKRVRLTSKPSYHFELIDNAEYIEKFVDSMNQF